MKKILFVLLAVGLLSACGSDQATESTDETGSEDTMKQEESSDTNAGEDNLTDDVMEFADTSNDKDIITYNFQDYKLIDTYTSDSTSEDGFNTANFEGFEVTYSFALVEDMEGEQTIAFIAETLNSTSDTIQYNADMELKTSEGEQANMPGAFGSSDPDMKNKGMTTADLQYDVPDSFELTLEPPFKQVGENSYEEGHYGEAVTQKFSLE